jgi:site-specific DNA-cytosine methylase
MQELRDELIARTGQAYVLHHVLMAGASVGAAQMRHRYYPVFARVPFGVDEPQLDDLPDGRVVTYDDAIGDLVGARLTWENQSYPTAFAATEFQRKMRTGARYLTQHITLDDGRIPAVLGPLCDAGWAPGESLPEAAQRTGYHPPSLAHNRYEDGEYKGWSWPRRIKPDRPGYVLTGGGIHGFVHWAEPRLLTVREMTRLMGYPDTWAWPTTSPNKASMWIGKCCPVTSGAWISNWVANAIEGEPGAEGDLIGPNERYFNFTNLYKQWPQGTAARVATAR